MGKGTIISSLGAGKYSVQLNFHRKRVEDRLKQLVKLIPEILQATIDAETVLVTAQNAWKDTIVALNGLIAAGDAQTAEGQERIRKQMAVVLEKETAMVSASAAVNQARLLLTSYQKEQARLQYDMPDDATIEAWCADYTEDLSGIVGTVEIPGERGTVQIQPGYAANAKYAVARDGQIQPSVAGAPAGTFWNMAMLPGWQKWKPTYRHGTISAIDYVKHTCSITLDAAISGAQNLDINQALTLTKVPIQYMECNAIAFGVNDRVLIKFEGQDFKIPKVIGFADNPHPCFLILIGLYPNPSDTTEIIDRAYLWQLNKNEMARINVSQPNTVANLTGALTPYGYGYWMAGNVENLSTGTHSTPPPPNQSLFFEDTRVHPSNANVTAYASDLYVAGAAVDDVYMVIHTDVDEKARYLDIGTEYTTVKDRRTYYVSTQARVLHTTPETYEYFGESTVTKRELSIIGKDLNHSVTDETDSIPETYPPKLPMQGGLGLSGAAVLADGKKKAVLVNSAYNTETGIALESNVWSQTYETIQTMAGWQPMDFSPNIGLNFVAMVYV